MKRDKNKSKTNELNSNTLLENVNLAGPSPIKKQRLIIPKPQIM